jgi:hypothetical protein
MTYAPLLEHAHDKQGIGETELHQTLGGAAYPPIAEAQNDAGQPKHASPDESNAQVIASRASDPLSDDHESLTFHPLPASKPTNPKDAIGSKKLPLQLVPDTVAIYACMAFAEGASKYGQFNWRSAGVRFSIYYAAMQRHQKKLWNGEWADPETKVPHLSSIIACAGILADAHECGKLTDDRPPRADMPRLIEEAEAIVRHVVSMHADKSPRHYTIADAGLKL